MALVYLDTNVFIRAVETTGEAAVHAQQLLQALRAKPLAAATSELTLAELTAPSGQPNAFTVATKRRLYLSLLVVETSYNSRLSHGKSCGRPPTFDAQRSTSVQK